MVTTNDIHDDNMIVDGITNEDKQKSTENAAINEEQMKSVTDEEFENAQKLFKTGKKNFLLGNYNDAVSNIADACKVYASKYGELNGECADIYFYYGKALLELARGESTVFGDQLNEKDEEEEEEEEKGKEENGVSGDNGEAEDKSKNEESADNKEEKEKVAPGTSAETGTGEDEEEDVDEISNLEQAWEMFELAKLIYKSHYKEKNEEDKYFKLKRICECLLKLGEISIEQELFDQAISDINESIKIQEDEICGSDIDKRDERLLAESYYQLSLVHQLKNSFSMAKELHNKSINILQLCLEKLKLKLAKLEESKKCTEKETSVDVSDKSDDLEKKELVAEINELELLIPEMCSKIDEINEQEEQEQQSLNAVKEIAKECILSISSTSKCTPPASSSSEAVKDITDLIKSKRKMEPSPETVVKKHKTETNETNGDTTSCANGGTNGENN